MIGECDTERAKCIAGSLSTFSLGNEKENITKCNVAGRPKYSYSQTCARYNLDFDQRKMVFKQICFAIKLFSQDPTTAQTPPLQGTL